MKSIVTITGPSMGGKTTLSFLLEKSGPFSTMVSHTTRKPRNGERSGVDYYFVTPDQFSETKLIEYSKVGDYYYGLSESELNRHISLGLTGVVVMDPYGVEQIADYSQKHGVNHFKLFLNTPVQTRVRRWLERVKTDTATPFEVHAKKLATMLEIEEDWIEYIKWDLVLGEDKTGLGLPTAMELMAQKLNVSFDVARFVELYGRLLANAKV